MNVHVRVPDMAFRLAGGPLVNLSDFEGQKLALFCAADGDCESFRREAEDYAALAEQFAETGTWVLGLARSEIPATDAASSAHVRTAVDPDGSCIESLRSCLGPEERGTGGAATLVIDRDGTVRAAWASGGHARDALDVAREHP